MDPTLSPTNSAVSTAVIDQLVRTKGWTRFFSVLLWIGAGFLVLGGIALIGMGAASGLADEALADQFGGAMATLPLGILYFLMAFIYIYPALKLGKFSSRIADLSNQPTETHLVSALNEQRAFWKYVGIWMIVFFALYIVVIIGAICFGAIGAMTAAGGPG
ncbi:MAG: DUF5362 family protein [Verrucomicrobiales bacterium]|nr:DUF5362 family protein [Verrucomicrobiales bacterium]